MISCHNENTVSCSSLTKYSDASDLIHFSGCSLYFQQVLNRLETCAFTKDSTETLFPRGPRVSVPVLIHQSIPAVPIPPPPPGHSRIICSRCQPGARAFIGAFIAAQGLGVSVPQAAWRAFGTHVFERWMSLSGRTRPLSKPKLPAKGKQQVH